jgi:hypothetical protein
MLLLVQNRILTKDREKTFLTASVAVAGTTLTVKAVDGIAWADNDWIIVGEIGTANAEVLQINGAVSDGTSLTIDNAGSGGARYAHSADEPVYRLDYNKVKFYQASTATGAKTLLATNELQPDDYETRYEDTANTTGYGFAAFFNSLTSALSPYSDAIPYEGQSSKSLAKMIDKVRTLIDENNDDFISDSDIVDAINDKQRDIINERLWTFNECEYTASSVDNQFEYDIPEYIKTLHTVRFNTKPLVKISEGKWEILHWDTNTESDNPTHCGVWNDKVRVYPRPSESATTTTLGAAIASATATSITVADSTDFKRGDYFRFIIDSEVIYATGSTATTFTGCLRGREGTTATTHLIAATVTERNIVFTGQKEAVDLEQQNDETVVPEPQTICYGVASDFCLGALQKETLGDRYQIKYDKGLEALRNRFTLKLTSQFSRVKDPREVVSDYGQIIDPNQFPTNVTGA